MAEKNLKGLSQDTRPLEQPEGTYPFGKNGIQHDTKGVIINEPGFGLDPATIPGEVCGVIETDGPTIIFSIDGGVSKVGYYHRNTNSYELRKDDSTFPATDKWNFSPEHYITGEFQRNYLNERMVAWTDKDNPPRVLNLDNNADIASAKETLLFLQANTPQIDVAVESGGSLGRGAYFVAAKLLKRDGSETGYLTTVGPSTVATNGIDSATDKALNITLTSLDQTYDQVQVAIISRVNGAYTALALDPVEVSSGPVTVLYTGENPGIPITLDEVLVPNAVYTKVGTIGQLNDALFVADLEKEPELDMQKYASMIKVRVKSELINVLAPPQEHIQGKKRSLMHQEVYGLYVRYHRTIGVWTRAFHIPGNVPLSSDLAAATLPHEQALGASVFHVRDTTRNANTASQTVDTGIWVNENETYPNIDAFNSTSVGGEDLRGKKVRHHRMPSIAWCKDNFYSSNTNYGKTELDILGLEISNVIIPANLSGDIDGYEILIARRSMSNSTVLGQSLLMVESQPYNLRNSEKGYVFTGGNWASSTVSQEDDAAHDNFLEGDSLRPTGFDNGNWTDAGTPKPGLRFRFHAFDMLFNRPTVQPAYIAPQLKLRASINHFEDGEIDDNPANILNAIDYTAGTVTVVPGTHRLRALDSSRYLPNNVDLGEYNNTQQESAYVGKLKWIGATGDVTNNGLPMSIPRSTVNLDNFQRPTQKPNYEETYLVNLMDHRVEVYNNFYSQPLVASGQFITIGGTAPTVYAGDTFLGRHSFNAYGWYSGLNPHGDNRTSGYKTVHSFICEAVSNLNLRYEVAGNIYSKWWPNNPLAFEAADNYLLLMDRDKDPNQFGYSKDLNTVNDFGNYRPYNPFGVDQTKFPFRIHRGGKMPRQGKLRSWRTFLPLDYYEAQKNMGRIVKVLGKDDRLLIYHENALFVTQDKAKLDAGMLSVTLGTGDIFQFEPQEALSSKQGYAGTQHELAVLDTPWGVLSVDARQGQVFLYKDGVKLMNQGLNQFFRQYLRVEANNPFVGNGITIGYDPEYKRILLTVKNAQMGTALDAFVPNYETTPEFYQKLTAGTSIVYKNGRYQKFLGVNATQYTCPEVAAPVGTDAEVTISENAPLGHNVINAAAQFSGIAPGAGSYVILSGNVGTAFTISGSGLITVNNPTIIDYDTLSEYSLVVKGMDIITGLSDTITVTVNITNENSAPVVPNYNVSISENAAVGTEVVGVVATDPEGDAVTYTLLTAGTPFAVNSATGVVTTTAALSYSENQEWVLQVKCCDAADACTTSTVTVQVLQPVTYTFEPHIFTCKPDYLRVCEFVKVMDSDGTELAIVLNQEGQTYNGVPVPYYPDETNSPLCGYEGA